MVCKDLMHVCNKLQWLYFRAAWKLWYRLLLQFVYICIQIVELLPTYKECVELVCHGNREVHQ